VPVIVRLIHVGLSCAHDLLYTVSPVKVLTRSCKQSMNDLAQILQQDLIGNLKS